MFKKFLSVLLAVMMVVSVMAVGVVATGAVTTDGFTPEANKLYFDVDGTGWTMAKNDKIAFYIVGGDLGTDANPAKVIDWGGKKLQGTAVKGETGVFEFDPAAKADYNFTPGVQYKVIFARVSSNNWKEQTCSLFFTTDCFGHVAYSDGTEMENDVDSTKLSKTVYWRGIDPEENGPVLAITSIGNVVGSCVEQGKTKYSLFEEFISEAKSDFSGRTGLQNAIYYTVEQAKTKTEQQMIDDIGAALELTKDDVAKAFADTGVETTWTAEDSTLSGGEAPHVHTPGEPVQENVKPATCTEDGSYDEVVYCTEDNEEISRETKTIPATGHTPGEPVQDQMAGRPATCTEDGEIVMVTTCTVCGAEISRETITIPATGHTPGEAVFENEIPATCTEDGSYDVVVYCTVCGEELSRTTEVDPAEGHTTTAPVKENEVEADCENAGGYDEVIYCGNCGEVIDTHHVDIPALGHEIVFVEEVPATASTDGVKAHYECTRCGKLFADETGTIEVTAEDLVIKAEHTRGDADGDGEITVIDATTIQRVLANLPVTQYDEISADADLDGIVDMIDVTLIQRVDAKITTFEKWDAAHKAL